MLRHIIANAIHSLKITEPNEYRKNPSLEKLVIAVPAMSTAQKYGEFIRKCAGAASGLQKSQIELIDEPRAVALSYFSLEETSAIKSGSRIAVFDLGGGTFDAAVIGYNDLHEEKFSVITSSGNTGTGGTDWDKKLSEFILSENDRDKLLPNELYLFELAVIKAKEELSSSSHVNFTHMTDSGLNITKHNLTRQEFESVTKRELNKIINDRGIT